MENLLDEIEVRVLGSLMEKALATPDYYPLSLNALTAACNQKSSRHPVVSYDEQTVRQALARLEDKGLVWESLVGRVPKYEERFSADRKWIARESSVLCVLLLRGPQTAGEIRSRSARFHAFESLETVLQTLEDLSEGGYVVRLEREPGCKEPRYAHLLAGLPAAGLPGVQAAPETDSSAPQSQNTARIEALEQVLLCLREELENLKTEFERFKKQFD